MEHSKVDTLKLFEILERVEKNADGDQKWFLSKDAMNAKVLIDEIFEQSFVITSAYKKIMMALEKEEDTADQVREALIDLQVSIKHQVVDKYVEHEADFNKYISKLYVVESPESNSQK